MREVRHRLSSCLDRTTHYDLLEKPLLRLNDLVPYLRCRIGELYLIVMGREGALRFGCWYDSNVYEEDLVQEWVAEIVAATRHFLVSPSDHRRAQANL